MSVELYNNFTPKIAQHIDSRLVTVSDISSLPDPTIPGNFLYEGALAYVAGSVDAYYKCVLNSLGTALEWQPFNANAQSIGSINITPGTTVLDLNLVTPSISDCYAVQINIVGGTSATIQSISNVPGNDQLITFYVEEGNSVTFKHTDYDAASTDHIVLEVGLDITITGRLIGNESLTLKKHGVANCQWDATQFVKSTEWLQSLLSLVVEDNLTSTSTTSALSAYQGNLLNQALQNKQNLLTPGAQIDITNDVISHIPRNWEAVTAPGDVPGVTGLSAISAMLSHWPGISDNFRLNYLWNYTNNSTLDVGTFLLPPGKDPSVLGNYVLIGKPSEDDVSHQMFKSVEDLNPAGSLVGGAFYYPRWSTLPSGNANGVVGDGDISFNYNTDGPTSEKVSINVAPGLYSVKARVLALVAAGNIRRFKMTMYNTDGVQLSTNPINTGNILTTTNNQLNPSETLDVIVPLEVDFTIKVLNENVDSAITFQIIEANNNWTNVIFLDQGTLQFTKYETYD